MMLPQLRGAGQSHTHSVSTGSRLNWHASMRTAELRRFRRSARWGGVLGRIGVSWVASITTLCCRWRGFFARINSFVAARCRWLWLIVRGEFSRSGSYRIAGRVARRSQWVSRTEGMDFRCCFATAFLLFGCGVGVVVVMNLGVSLCNHLYLWANELFAQLDPCLVVGK